MKARHYRQPQRCIQQELDCDRGKAEAFTKAFRVSTLATVLLGVAVIGQVASNADLAGPVSFITSNAPGVWTRALELWSQVQEGRYGREDTRQAPDSTPAPAEP